MEHKIVSYDEWRTARIALLAKEKELTRLRDKLSAERRELPWVKVEKNYLFDAPEGQVSLSDLFEGRSQLMVKHFMLAPGREHPCVGCSFEVDHVGGALLHLERHDVKYVAIARAPIAEIEAMKKRMNWGFRWVSAFHSDFNYDFHVSFTEQQLAAGEVECGFRKQKLSMQDISGNSVFFKNERGEIFHTYSTFGRGLEELLGAYMILDVMPKGRNEHGPRHNLTDWVRLHDRYDEAGSVDATGRYRSRAQESQP